MNPEHVAWSDLVALMHDYRWQLRYADLVERRLRELTTAVDEYLHAERLTLRNTAARKLIETYRPVRNTVSCLESLRKELHEQVHAAGIVCPHCGAVLAP